MSEFGERLKEERVRLCLSQSAMAERLGIHRNTQIKYESGERDPDTNYLDAAQNAGVDIYYLHTGIKVENKDNAAIARMVLAAAVYRALGLSDQDVDSSVLELSKLVEAEYKSDSGDVWHSTTVPRFVSGFLSRSPVLSAKDAVSIELLTAILVRLDDAASILGQAIAPEKKARAVAMLYRAFKASGKVDPAMIEEAVKLAS